MMETTLHQAATLSSGTISALIDENEYEKIDKVRYWFIRFVARAVNDEGLDPMTPWQTAWELFAG